MKVLKFLCFTALLCIVFSAAAGYYALKIEPYMLVVKHHQLGTESIDSIRMVQISDIQVSEDYNEAKLEKLVDKINEQQPDLLLFTGDLYENYAQYGPEDMVIEQLSKIEAPLGKYAIWGNRDYGGGCARRYAQIITSAGFTLLQNEGTAIQTDDGSTLFLAGLDDALLGEPDISQVPTGHKENDTYKILMTHEPDVADKYADQDFSLILSGHSHGGQAKVPFIKPYRTSLAEKYISGFYPLGENGDTLLYVNQGIGTSHYTVRFAVPPEITVFDLVY